MKKRKWYVYDIETYLNCLLVGFKNIETEKDIIFELNKYRNDIPRLNTFLKRNPGLIGFNNHNYDTHILNAVKLGFTNNQVYYNLSQRIIEGKTTTPYNNEIDLMKMFHFDRFGVSLKKCELVLNMKNVQDLPYKYDKILKKHEIEKLKLYLHNDLEATYLVYKQGVEKLSLRKVFSKELGVNMLSYSDSKLGETLLEYYINQEIDLSTVKKQKFTPFNISDVIFDYIKFDDPILNNVLDTLKTSKIETTKGGININFEYAGLEFTVAQGGLHAAKKGIYVATDNKRIMSIDVAGMYPSIIIQNKLYPKHLGPTFYEILDQKIVTPRTTIHKPMSKKAETPEERMYHATYSDGLKLAGKIKN